jgi:hypothetical protein
MIASAFIVGNSGLAQLRLAVGPAHDSGECARTVVFEGNSRGPGPDDIERRYCRVRAITPLARGPAHEFVPVLLVVLIVPVNVPVPEEWGAVHVPVPVALDLD